MKLSEYLIRNRLPAAAFAAVVGVSHTTIGRIIKGQIEPRRALRARIVAATDGVVTEADLLLPAEPAAPPSKAAA